MSISLPLLHTIELGQTLTIAVVDEIGRTLLDGLDRHQALAVDCDAATEIDITFLQLLIAAQKSAKNSGRQFGLKAPLPAVLTDAAARCGLAIIEGSAGLILQPKGTPQ